MDKFHKAAGKLGSLSEEGLSRVSKLVELQLAHMDKIEQLEKELKEAKKDLRKVSELDLPEVCNEYGITGLPMSDGSELKIKTFVSASIPKDRMEEAFDWLVKNEKGDLIKNQVSTSFVRGQESQAQAFVKELEERQFAVSTRKWIEPMSLKYFCKEQTEKGVSIPPDLFGLHIGQKATITKPKE
jgi:hypothetical protein|tara:strand:- start:285 stop:839 length:555 start_codon:yes stop_codon:yes gene_type:complete